MTTNDTTAADVKPRARRAKPAASAVPTPAPTTPASKSDTVIKLLLRTKGATPLELIAATDWQAHSVRAFLSGLRKKGRSIVREPRKTGPAAYRVVSATADDRGSATPPSDRLSVPAAPNADGAA